MDLSKYPRVELFLKQHPGMTLDDALVYVEKEIDKLEECSVDDKLRNNSKRR